MNLTIGSGDIASLMSGKDTAAFKGLLRKFISDDKPYYNALASPIDACRIGAIIESRYLDILPDNYMVQYKVTSEEMDAFTSSIDFAKIESGKIVDFDELKSIYFADFIEHIEPLRNEPSDVYLPIIRKKFKKYYNQVQAQLFCSGLQSANLVFVPVYSYDDDDNEMRKISENEIVKLRIQRDECAINEIKERGMIFQKIKDFFKQ